MQEDAFRVKFDWPDVPDLALDERAPLTRSVGPHAARRIGAAMANWSTSSRCFYLRKSAQSAGLLPAEVRSKPVRNDRGSMRTCRVDVMIHLDAAPGTPQHVDRCHAQFDDSCVVTETDRHGIPGGVQGVDPQGKVPFQRGDGA